MKRSWLLPPPIFLAGFLGVSAACFLQFEIPKYTPQPTTKDVLKTKQTPQNSVAAPQRRSVNAFPSRALFELAQAPLFSPTRLPLTPTKTENTVAAQPPEIIEMELVAKKAEIEPRLAYLGLISSGKLRKVLVRDLDQEKDTWLKEAGEIQGWKLVEITQRNVKFLKADKELIVPKAQ